MSEFLLISTFRINVWVIKVTQKGVMVDKVTVPAYFIPDTSWYVPTEIEGSPRQRDEQARKRKHKIWLPKRVRKHPKIKRIFGNPKKKTSPQPRKRRDPKKPNRRFNRLVEQAHTKGKL